MKLLDWLLGRSLATSEEGEQKIGPASGVSMLGLDALSSSAYGPEAALTVLLPLGATGLHYVLSISWAIIALLFVVYLSYRQTIQAYPSGGGSYTVAKENLGRFSGLMAAAALLLDYILTVAVGISAGIGALISAVPALQPFTLELCLGTLTLITIVNLRGIKESGMVFMFPTYIFIVSLLAVIVLGVIKSFLSNGHPMPVEPLSGLSHVQEPATMWLLLRAFASGCTAMTGVEAVSNGVKVFREPVVAHARRTLSAIVFILIVMLAGITYLAVAYGVTATVPGEAGYESTISQLVRAILGRGVIYYCIIGSVISVLALSANTAFADFPRLCQIIANDNYLPHALAERGRRLVFSYGIIILALLAGLLLLIFDGVTDRLIPLYAIGAFLAFTMSQSGMVVHWWKRNRKVTTALMINLLGATATAGTLLVVLVSKFSEGGWITAVLMGFLLAMFVGVRRHYFQISKEIFCREPLSFAHTEQPLVIVPIREWSKLTRKALGHAIQLSTEVFAIHVQTEDLHDQNLISQWQKYVIEPSNKAGVPAPELVLLPNPYRKLFGSFMKFIDELEAKNPERRIAVVLPILGEFRWYHYFLHNERAVLLNASLFLRRDRRISVVTIPWFLDPS
jgi:amino acid transporter